MVIEDHLPAFPRSYRAKVLDELPTTKLQTLYFPGASEISGRDGLIVSVIPNQGSPWIGVFGFGFGGGAITALLSTPDASKLLVVSRGAGYLVNPENPGDWHGIREIIPITTVRPAPAHKIIVLADYTTIAAVDATGLLWRTARLSFDGIVIEHINSDYIEGEAWDPTTPLCPRFRVDIRSGKHEGGSSPAKYGA